jgi:hypothetical protein
VVNSSHKVQETQESQALIGQTPATIAGALIGTPPPIVATLPALLPKRKADSRESILQELYGGVSNGSQLALTQSNQRREKVLLNQTNNDT